MAVTATYYDFFRTFFVATDPHELLRPSDDPATPSASSASLIGFRIPASSFPQYLNYVRVDELELWCLFKPTPGIPPPPFAAKTAARLAS